VQECRRCAKPLLVGCNAAKASSRVQYREKCAAENETNKITFFGKFSFFCESEFNFDYLCGVILK
jgi:hypothetical protein